MITRPDNVKIHETAEVSEQAAIGAGSRIWNQAQVRENAHIGRGCIIGKDVYIDFGVRVGDNVKIQNGSYLYHGLTIEAGVFIGPGVIFTNDKNPRAVNPDGSIKSADDWLVGETHVLEGASLGAGAIILPGVKIGRFAMVGAGAVVTRDVPDYGLVYGQPARLAGYVCKCATRLVHDVAYQYHCPACGEAYLLAGAEREVVS